MGRNAQALDYSDIIGLSPKDKVALITEAQEKGRLLLSKAQQKAKKQDKVSDDDDTELYTESDIEQEEQYTESDIESDDDKPDTNPSIECRVCVQTREVVLDMQGSKDDFIQQVNSCEPGDAMRDFVFDSVDPKTVKGLQAYQNDREAIREEEQLPWPIIYENRAKQWEAQNHRIRIMMKAHEGLEDDTGEVALPSDEMARLLNPDYGPNLISAIESMTEERARVAKEWKTKTWRETQMSDNLFREEYREQLRNSEKEKERDDPYADWQDKTNKKRLAPVPHGPDGRRTIPRL
jgi:hypothetical protein